MREYFSNLVLGPAFTLEDIDLLPHSPTIFYLEAYMNSKFQFSVDFWDDEKFWTVHE